VHAAERRSSLLARRAVRGLPSLCSRKRRRHARIRTTIQVLIGATVIAGGMATLTPAAQATTPVACSENALVAAITLANSTSAADTLALAGGCTYGLTSAHGGLTTGLPVITTPIEMIGPATITRTSLLPFRIAEVSSTGSLTLTTSVAITERQRRR
jgi:hypothetical protein